MLRVSRFSSINFDEDWKLPFQIQECYLQKFKPSDQPRVQYSLETASALKPFMDINGAVSEINTSEVVVIEDTTIREFVVNLGSVVSRTNVEIFFAESAQGSRELSAIIDVDPDVENTVLIEYTNRRNDFDTVFNPANKFSFRVEGCFLPQEVSFDSETESFRDQRHKSKLLSGFPVEKRTLSIGGGFGVPNWAARLINGIFCLSNVEVDGERMIRVDGGVELSMIHNDYPLYIYKIELEHTEDEEVSDILSLLRVVDSKKKVARSTGDDVRVYNAFAKDLGITDSKMIRELSTIQEIAENFYIEIDDNVSSNTAKATLKVLQQFIFNGWIDQPVRTTDDVKFNSVTSSNGKWEISEDGIIKIVKAVVMDAIQSDNFFSGSMGSGFSMMKNDSTGKSYLEIDKIYARVKAIFQSVEIRKLLYSIGNYTYGPAGAKCTKVVEAGDVYRCFFTADDGEVAVENTFHIDDLVKCQEFNVKAGVYGVTGNRYYWRRCVGIGTDYIDLSKSDCDADSDIPEVGDDMVTQGNKTDKERQSVIVISVVGEDAPSVTLYDGINDYSLDGKAKTRVGGGSVDSFFTGNFFLTNGKNVQDEIDKTNQSVDQTIQDMANTINLVKELEQNVGNLQDQIDGVIETWFYDPVPTLSNEPAVNWTTDNDKNNHLGDLYFDKDGKAYRFENRDGVYQWTVIPDTGLEEALRKAQQAQDTADGKRRIFTDQPTTESTYDVGDLWVNATAGSFTNDILRCKVAKISGQAFSLSHWELASKYTDDTKANEAMQNAQEAQEAADAAQAAADKAQGDANTAKDAADAAKAEADSANSLLSDIANDNKLTAQEKQQTKKEWDIIVSEKPLNDASADKFGVSKTEYTDAYNALSTYITPLLQSLTTTSDIVGSTFRTTFKNYYDSRTELLNNISAKAKDLADAAQNTADVAQENADAAKKEAKKALAKAESAQSAAETAQSTADAAATAANNAQNTANTAKTTAEAANSELNKINSDGYISPSEKGALVQQQKDIQSEYADIISQANKYGVSTTNYTTAYNSANTALTKYTATSPTHIEVGADYANIAAYYTARQTILDAISTAAKKVATDAQADADAAKEAAEQAKQDAATAQATANDAKADAAAAKSAADAANAAISDLEANIEGAFADGIISEAEAIAISKYTNQVNESFTSINATYTEVYGNVYLEGTAKTNLKTKYDALVTKKNALLNAISTAIADGKATQAESKAVDSAFTAYNSAVNSYQTALEQANEAIQTKIKSYADAAQEDANKALQDAAEAKAKADAAASDAKDANDRLNSWASDSVISPTEKQAIKNEQAQVRAEKNEIVADAGKYSIATTTYVNAFTSYDNVLTKYSASSPENITIGTDFNSTQTTYYAERTKILGLIADGAKKYVDDISIGMVNLLKDSNVELNKQAYNVGGYSYHAQPKTGKQYTLVVCYTLGINNSYMYAYEDGGINNITPSFSKKGDMIVESRTFTFRSTNNPPLMNFFQFPNGTYGSKVHWAVLVEGNKGPNGWIPSQYDLNKPLEEYKTEVTSQFEKTDERISQSVTETKTYTDSAIGNIKIGSVNLISKKMMLAWNEKNPNIAVWGQGADGVYLGIDHELLYRSFMVDGVMQDIFSNKIKYKSNTQYILSIKWKLEGEQDYSGLVIYINYTDGTRSNVDLMPHGTTLHRSNIKSSKDKTIKSITCSYGINTYRSLIYAISLIEGNQIPTEIPEAVEDITGQSNVNLLDNGKVVEAVIYKKLPIILKPNTVYNISVKNIVSTAGDQIEFLVLPVDKDGKSIAYTNLINNSTKNAIFITHNTFEEQKCYINLYAGPTYNASWKATWNEVMIVEGFVPPSSYSGSENDAATVAMEKTITGINNTPGLLELYATQEQYNSQQELIGQVDSRITVQAGRIDSVVSDISGLNTRISQTESDIELKVDASGIISAINLSKEGVAIKGDRIEITGQTVFKDSNGNKLNIFGQGDKVLTVNNGVFSVSETGLLTSTNADIQGKITATSGKIGGFDIGTGGGYWLSSGDMGLSGSQLTFKDSERAVYIGSNPSEATGGDPITGWLQIGSLTPTIRATDRCALLLSVTGSTSTARKNYALLIENGDVKFGNSAFMGKPYVWAYQSNGYIPVERHFVIQALGHTGSDNPCYISNTGAYEGQIIIIINRNTSHRLNVRGTSVGDHWIPDGSCGLFVFSGDMQKWVPLRT